jgi:hypothetical protein
MLTAKGLALIAMAMNDGFAESAIESYAATASLGSGRPRQLWLAGE